MKKTLAFLLSVLLLCGLLGCTPTLPAAVEPATSSPVPQTATPAPTEDATPAPSLGEGEYVLDSPITVDNGRVLTLRLYGMLRDVATQTFGIKKIEVLDGTTLVQTILMQDAILAQWDDMYADTEYTESYEKNGCLTVNDMNFDGAGDIGLMGWITAGANLPFYYWLWNADAQCFEYSFYLCNAEVDAADQQIVSMTRVGAGCYYTEYYKYNDAGALEQVKRVVNCDSEDPAVTDALNIYFDGIHADVEIGTTGAAAKAAAYAAKLLDWYVEAEPTLFPSQISAVVNRFYNDLPAEEQPLFEQQIRAVHTSADIILGVDGGELLGASGYTPKAYVWEQVDADLLFAYLYDGVGILAEDD